MSVNSDLTAASRERIGWFSSEIKSYPELDKHELGQVTMPVTVVANMGNSFRRIDRSVRIHPLMRWPWMGVRFALVVTAYVGLFISAIGVTCILYQVLSWFTAPPAIPYWACATPIVMATIAGCGEEASTPKSPRRSAPGGEVA